MNKIIDIFNDVKKNFISRDNVLGILGGIIFLMIFINGYKNIDKNFYEYRDDGVITMSVAKNFVEYGFFGVSKSGPIVEASSSPIQTFFYTIVYALTDMSYSTFSYFQTYLFTFLIGYFFILFFKEKIILALFLTLISSLILTKYYTFFEWHASGMENPITHFLFLLTTFILYSFIKNGKINNWLSIMIFFATIVRLDSVYHIAPLLVIFSIFWLIIYKNYKGLIFSIFIFSIWLIFHIWRYWYYGDFLPNTAYAQGISMSDRIKMLLTFDYNYIQESIELSKQIFQKHAGLLFVFFIPLIINLKLKKEIIFLLLLIISIILTTLFNPMLFGQTRIDIGRTTTQMAIFSVLIICILLYNSKNIKFSFLLALVIMPFFFIVNKSYSYEPYYLGWSTNGFNNVRSKFMKIAEENELLNPKTSNPDLGVLTWYKELNTVDLGMLGSPIMANLKNGPILKHYYLNYAQPDIIEAHGDWIERYCSSIFTSKEFNDMYSQVGSNFEINKICKSEKKPQLIFWIRNDIKIGSNTKERLFLDKIQKNLNVELIKKEIDECTGNCSYISRVVYKFIPELRKKELFYKVYDLFEKEIDKALLIGWHDGQAYKVIIEKVYQDLFENLNGIKIISNEWDVYYDQQNNKLTYLKDVCTKEDIGKSFYLHYKPLDTTTLDDKPFLNLDFSFNNNGIEYKGKCLKFVNLPSGEFEKIDTGQFTAVKENDKTKFINHWNDSYAK